jgi:outer membrane receptor protein involved in Fe transport
MEDQGEPRFPVIRGLRSTYNRTTIDGALVASVDESGRTVPMDIVPSVMAGRLEVIKTVTPENDGNAIGGVINVTTRSAFDAGKPFFNGMASYGDYERSGGVRNDKPSYRLSLRHRHDLRRQRRVGRGRRRQPRAAGLRHPAGGSRRPLGARIHRRRRAGAVGRGDRQRHPGADPARLFWYNNTKQRAA